ncbi:MAG TPA: DNA mismatch repair endonuclease MutL [Ktedonobacteraceae bacterium]|nr:DNA mismatch repair endonuclease MutL [Ktedonobacteraceae bacterium]
MPIRQLAPDVAAKIAAGEVVERPASVVKELIENSIDAGATQIRVELTNGGLQLIRVTDNGSGIPADELELALARHATSKVALIDDLEHIRSLGFRGEALASIAAVADVTLLSHHREAEQAAQIHAQNGEFSSSSVAASPVGTTLTVRNLFSAVPARLKFLKSRNTEVSHCLHLLEQYALAYPGIRFQVISEGRQLFATPGDGQLSSVLVEIYGLQVAEQMVPISSLDGRDDDPERPVVSGYTSLPACYKSTRQHMSFFVNRRWVLSRVLSYAVEEAYHSLLLPGRHPIAVVNIELDPTQIDVNVHPAKTEIRFLKERRVYAAILRAVRSALLSEATVPTWSGQHTPVEQEASGTAGAAPVAPEEFDDDLPLDEPPGDTSTAPRSALPQANPWLTVTEEETGTKPPLAARLWQTHVNPKDHTSGSPGLRASLVSLSDEEENEEYRPQPGAQSAASPSFTGSTESVPLAESAVETPGQPVQVSSAPPLLFPVDNRAGTQQAPLLPIEAGLPVQQELLVGQGHLPTLRVIGQLAQSYIVTEGEQGLYLIDQHAAHERVLLEKMVEAQQTRAPLSQLLLTPIALELSPAELGALEDHQEQLEQIGFELSFQDNAVLVSAVPQVLIKQMNARSLHELLAELTAPENLGHAETWEEHALANVACKAAVKANYFLTMSEMRELLGQLAQTKAPYSCCHGRPTTVHFNLRALEREFGRR